LRLSEALSVAGVPSASGDKLLTATHGAKIARIANAFQRNSCAALCAKRAAIAARIIGARRPC
jgi:hypothetical protein